MIELPISNRGLCYLIIIAIMMTLQSCSSTKNFTYLRDVDQNEVISNLKAINMPVYTIEVKDNLFVSIISSNVEMNKLYNPAVSGTQSSSFVQYEGSANQYVNGFEVDGHGDINLPLLKKINVVGLTVEQIEQKIQSVASEYLKDVTVKVKLLSYRVTVMGEVKNPGVYYNFGKDFTVMNAISMASGTNDYAKLSKVLVLRQQAKEVQTFTLDLNSKSSIYAEGFFLQPNDVVIVQPSKNKNILLKSPVITVFFSAVSSFLLLLKFVKL